jgi:hypothetical protein
MKRFALLIIILLAFLLRLYGINWDNGGHLHPDERMLIMVADKIHFFDQLNPDFFNYGSLPIYLLKGTTQLLDFVFKTTISTYDGMLLVGRLLSVFFDLGTLLVVYQITKLLFRNTKYAIISSFLYAISFFPIQNTHFFVVDVFLTFFITGTLYWLLSYAHSPSNRKIFFMGILLAAALATKVTAIIFLPVICIGIFVISFKISKEKTSFYRILTSLSDCMIFICTLIIAHILFMPYAYISYLQFLNDTLAQTQMSRNAYIFPYTLQYVYTLPYIYFLKNIFLWGVGPVISLLAMSGIAASFYKINKNYGAKNKRISSFFSENKLFILFGIYYILYFLIIGKSAVKFMRYMLPLYPFITIIAGATLASINKKTKLIAVLICIFAFIWTLSFVHIYTSEHTRIVATKWILKHIPKNSTLAVEHWDDRLPIYGGENYNTLEMQIYNTPDDKNKWSTLQGILDKTDYLIIASNRLYTPLSKLSDCKKYTLCYPLTKKYYENLFANKLNFRKVAEFSANPTIPFLPIEFSDQSADESFTVYDHPKIMIFKKN